MPSTALIDVAVGLAFVYLFFSLVCSVVNEAITVVLALRSASLVDGLDNLFSRSAIDTKGTSFIEAIYNHGLVGGLFKNPPPGTTISGTVDQIKKDFKKILPAYIPSQVFALALFDSITKANGQASTVPSSTFERLKQIRKAVEDLPDSQTKTALLSLAASAGGDLAKFQSSVETWFNDSMDRAASWYKRRAQRILLGLGIGVALIMNVDSIRVAETLWSNPAAREATATLAQQYVDTHKGDAKQSNPSTGNAQANPTMEDKARALAELGQKLPVPFGWGWETWPQLGFWSIVYFSLSKIAGWLITALALSLGAPFWFDTLNRFMAVRTNLKPKEDQP